MECPHLIGNLGPIFKPQSNVDSYQIVSAYELPALNTVPALNVVFGLSAVPLNIAFEINPKCVIGDRTEKTMLQVRPHLQQEKIRD